MPGSKTAHGAQMQALGSKLVPWLLRSGACGSTPAQLTKHKPLNSRLFSVAAEAVAAPAAAATATTKPPFKPSALSFVMFVPSVVCGYLAYWQYERSLWKEGLIKIREEKLGGEPVSVYELQDMEDYQKVSCSGRYIHERSIFVGPRPRSIPGYGIQSGYFLITPLYDPVRRGAVMVNRGWVPNSWQDDIKQVSLAWDSQPTTEPTTQPSTTTTPKVESKGGWFGARKPAAAAAAAAATAAVSEVVEVVGILQPSEKPSAVLPDNVPEKLEFHWVDVPALALAVGLPADTPLVQTISDDPATQQQHKAKNVMDQARQKSRHSFGSAPDYPIPKNTQDLINFTTMPKDHLIYTGIWSSLCVALALMARQTVFFPPKVFRMVNHGANNRDLWNSMASKPK